MFEVKFWVFIVAVVIGCVASEKNVVCYYSSWATYRWSTGKFEVADINTDLCTHVIYAFAGLETSSVVSLDPYLDLPENWGRDNYGAFTALKQKNPKLKTILAVGGWNEGSAKYSVMAFSASSRKVFIDSVVSIITVHGFDGIDLDWEYPNRRDTHHGVADVENFTLLLKELREEFDKHGWFLSSAVSSVRAMASQSYNIPEISKYLDMINIMAYDMYGAWDLVTGHNAPLHKGIGDVGDPADLFTVDVALQYWISQGAPVEKLALGVPFYGRTFTLSDVTATSVRAPASGPGISGTYTATNGFIGYNEFCYKLRTETWNLEYDSLAKVPYAHSGRNWVSYDNVDSITKKVEFAKSLGVNNIMVWSIEVDDFHGLCGDGDWPLLRAINKALEVDDTTGSSTVAPTVPSTVAPTTSPSTAAPTTSPSTAAPTTSPSTAAPTTSPSTAAPTTSPSTAAPTTSPSTAAPTTSPSTAAPTTSPSTAAPTTSPSTAASTTSPSTAASTTAPSTVAPTTGPTSASNITEAITETPTDTPTVPSPTTNAPSTSTTVTGSTSAGTTPVPTNPICTESGMVPSPTECTSFYMCVFSGASGFVPVKFMCPASLHWDQENQICNYPHLAKCSL